jgi:hypothetical protein
MTEGTTRTELARWFIDHDEVDEAARVLAPGDTLELGGSDSQNLAAALDRRGLAASYEGGLLRVSEASLGATPRRPPARSTPAPATDSKKKTKTA